MTNAKYSTAAGMIFLCVLASFLQVTCLSAQTHPQREDRASFVQRMNATHKAPYLPYPGWNLHVPLGKDALGTESVPLNPQQLEEKYCPKLTCLSTRVNQDLNPYSKSVGGLAVDITDPLNVVVASYDDRLGPSYVSDFVHVSTSAGYLWSDFEGSADQYEVEQIPKGVTIDRLGHTYVAVDSHEDQQTNTDTAVVVQLDPVGVYMPNVIIDSRYCQFDGLDDCNEVLQTQGIRTDLSRGSADGTTYVFYTVFCGGISTSSPCEGGTVPGGGSIMKVASSPGFNQPFTSPSVWSGSSQMNTGAGSMVVDSLGKAHLFYLDYTHKPQIALYESTDGVPASSPVLTFSDAGLNNPHWAFPEDKLLDCTSRGTLAFCVFTATQLGSGPSHTTPDVYFTSVNLVSGQSYVSRVNNDPIGAGKDHFNPSVAQTSDGSIFVGWFDNRADPANLKLDYFVGRTSDGRNFNTQMRVNQAPFDPTIGGVGPSGAIAEQGGSSIKAVWTDTRDGLTQQVRSTTSFGR